MNDLETRIDKNTHEMVVMKIEKRILIIGDDLTFLQSAKIFMTNSSTDVSYAISEKEALNYLLSSEYCLVIVCSLSFNVIFIVFTSIHTMLLRYIELFRSQ